MDVFFSPWSVETGMMVFGVIGDHDHPAARADAVASQTFHEREKGLTIELACFTAKQKSPVSQSHRAKISHAAPRGSMQQDGVLGFRRNPHLATGDVLLEVHLVGSPEILRRILHQRLEFFYAPSAVPDRPGPSVDAACVAESPVVGISAGTALPPGQSHTVAQSKPKGSCRPTDFRPVPCRGAYGEGRY